MFRLFAFGFILSTFLMAGPQMANAVESYTDNQQQEFVSWCTGEKSLTETACSCTVKRLAQTVPASALAQFLSSQGSFSLSAAAITTGASVTQALLACNK